MAEDSSVTYWGLLNATIDGGIAGARRDYTRPNDERLRGSLAGFEACREKQVAEMITLYSDTGRKAMGCHGDTKSDYWYWRCFQLEVEWVLNVLSAAMRVPLLGHLPTARGVMRAAEIIGVESGPPAEMTMETNKRYIGDGVFVDFDGYHLWLTTNDGFDDTNRIALEPNVWAALLAYVAALSVHPEGAAE